MAFGAFYQLYVDEIYSCKTVDELSLIYTHVSNSDLTGREKISLKSLIISNMPFFE